MMSEPSAAGPSTSTSPVIAKKRTRRSLNCEPCRLHKLKCNRARPCSGCVYRGTQDKCFPESATSEPTHRTAASPPSQSRSNGPSRSAPLDPMAELNQIQSSLSTLQRHYRSMKKQADEAIPTPQSAVYQEALLGCDNVESFFVGPTHSCTQLYNYFEKYDSSSTVVDPPSNNTLNLSKIVLSTDLIPWLPPKPALQTLIAEYLTLATWIFLYVDEAELNYKLDRYVNADELDELTMAFFFALSAVTLHYIPWDHKIRRNWPEDSNVTASRFYHFAQTIIDRSYELLMTQPNIALLEVHLILAQYQSTVKAGDSGEQMWSLSHKMVSLATSMGLHRDYGGRGLPEPEVTKRRWVWWNVISFERWTCVLLGRPMTLSNQHFDTHFPIPAPLVASQTALENSRLPYLMLFRYHLILGNVLDDLNDVVKPMTPERAAVHDAELLTWRESWPPDLELTEYKIATSLARTSEASVQRRGMQSLHLLGTYHYTRFIVHRAVHSPETPEILATTASAILGLISRCVHDIMFNPKMRVLGQIGIGPYYIFLPGMFYAHQLLDNPDQPAATNFRASLAEVLSIAQLSESIPTSLRTKRLLGPTSILSPPPADSPPPPPSTASSGSAGMQMSNPNNRSSAISSANSASLLANAFQDIRARESVTREQIKALRRITFPYVGLSPDVEGCDVEDILLPSNTVEQNGANSGVGTRAAHNFTMSMSQSPGTSIPAGSVYGNTVPERMLMPMKGL